MTSIQVGTTQQAHDVKKTSLSRWNLIKTSITRKRRLIDDFCMTSILCFKQTSLWRLFLVIQLTSWTYQKLTSISRQFLGIYMTSWACLMLTSIQCQFPGIYMTSRNSKKLTSIPHLFLDVYMTSRTCQKLTIRDIKSIFFITFCFDVFFSNGK